MEEIAQRPDVVAAQRYDGLNYDLSQDYPFREKPVSLSELMTRS
ncbi:hypothetical protein ANACOL_02944 [Anaerotruncus colihominis DSM 17241]|uniref:Uncharacterized protein n=1 Tax=Anaerotruncus colihominis DSM 17241 TaxID=445972 RepID=B0PEF3_9FIRM|nr:hypothetical protein ANACOL_02944 [Anaerotruncus colihominis DSM 17241]